MAGFKIPAWAGFCGGLDTLDEEGFVWGGRAKLNSSEGKGDTWDIPRPAGNFSREKQLWDFKSVPNSGNYFSTPGWPEGSVLSPLSSAVFQAFSPPWELFGANSFPPALRSSISPHSHN